MLPNTLSENQQWDRCPTRLRIGHSKRTHGHYMSREQPQHVKTEEDTPLTIKRSLMECPSLKGAVAKFCIFFHPIFLKFAHNM